MSTVVLTPVPVASPPLAGLDPAPLPPDLHPGAALLDAKRLDGRPHAPATANLALTAVRGVLREAAQLGLMTAEEQLRAGRVKAIPGRRLPPGRMLTTDELT